MEMKKDQFQHISFQNNNSDSELLEPEKKLLVCCLSDFIGGRESKSPSNCNWNRLYLFSELQQLSATVYSQCREFLPPETKFPNAYAAAVYSYMKRNDELRRISEAFNSHNIDFFLVKGPVIAQYYALPALRTMGDMDIVVHAEDRQRAHELMTGQGFKNVAKAGDREWLYYKDGLEYELHDRLIYEEISNSGPIEAFFQDPWQYVNNGALDPSYHFLFLLVHLRKHFMNSGVGFRQFVDLALMAQKEERLNWPWIRECLGELELLPFASTCFGFIKKWFDITIPLPVKIPDDAFYEETTERIFAGGVFGFCDQENSKNAVFNAARQGKNAKLAMAGRAAGLLFPSYDAMRTNEHYCFVDGKPFLLPAAWGYRWIRNAKLILKRKRRVPELFASKDELAKRDKFLKKWGL